MMIKTDFTDEEWTQLLQAPGAAGWLFITHVSSVPGWFRNHQRAVRLYMNQ